jgi:hypothetical protein
MFQRLREIHREVRDLASWLRREMPQPDDDESLLREVSALENTCASMRVLLSRRIAESKLWQRKGERSAAQITAFEDTWHWNEAAEDSYWQVLKGPNSLLYGGSGAGQGGTMFSARKRAIRCGSWRHSRNPIQPPQSCPTSRTRCKPSSSSRASTSRAIVSRS